MASNYKSVDELEAEQLSRLVKIIGAGQKDSGYKDTGA